MISSVFPTDWKDLQFQVARVLEECGMAVSVEQLIHTPRGDVVIDVYAEESIAGRRNLIIAECKHWASRVPQSVIHAFRTVIIEAGANQGYVISRAGFQSGAVRAISQTNLELLTWLEFQDAFEPIWLERHFRACVREAFERNDRGSHAATTGRRRALSELEQDQNEERLQEILIKYRAFYEIMLRHLLGSKSPPTLPIRESLGSEWLFDGTMPAAILDATGYREFLDAALKHADVAMSEWHAHLGAYRETE
jgi:restriction system protein